MQEAKVMSAKITLIYKNIIISDDMIFNMLKLDLKNLIQYVLDTRNMKHNTRKNMDMCKIFVISKVDLTTKIKNYQT